jgi:aquaporin Z
MEVGTNQHKLSLFLAEAAGTCVFFVGIFFTALYQKHPLAIAFGVGGGLFIAIIAFGKETGGHFNPAVTTGYFIFLLKERKKLLINYIILICAQITGGLLAGLLLYICSNSATPSLEPNEDNITGAIIDEIIFTFIFLLVIFCVKSRHTAHTKDGVLGALTVSMSLCFCIIYGGKISGGCYNPAVGIALNIWASLTNHKTIYLKYLHLYILAPLFGGLVSGLVVKLFLNKKIMNPLSLEEAVQQGQIVYERDSKFNDTFLTNIK